MNFDTQYIQPEERNGVLVDEKLKKVWAVQLDILEVFGKICKKHGLRWYAHAGTLLGAVRHHGFIPWDDDIDIAMPREDYNKLERICKRELKYPYEFQSTTTDKDCYMFWSCIKNSETTGNRQSCLNKRLNNGIGIDIIPLDGCEDNFLFYKVRRFPLRIASVICNTYVNEFNNSSKAVMLRRILRKLHINYKAIYNWVEKQNSKHPMFKSNQCTQTLVADPIVQTKEGLRRVIWKTEDFSSIIMMPFEYIEIPVPVGYDRILKTAYHDYMKMPPIDQRKGKHDVVFEPEIPYKEYCRQHYGVRYE